MIEETHGVGKFLVYVSCVARIYCSYYIYFTNPIPII
jgi:hypothetical protein